MTEKQRKIKDGLKLLASSFGPDVIMDGTVDTVYPDDYTCDVELDTGGIMYGCRLRATATGTKSIDVLPVEGSAVVIASMGAEEYLVLACDEISNYRVTIGNMVLQIDDTGFLIGNGTDTLKSLLTTLVQAVISIGAPKDVATLTELLTKISGLLK